MEQDINGREKRRPTTAALLAAACAGMLAPAATATTFVETTPEFGNSFSLRTPSPAGTDKVIGTLTNSTGDTFDFVQISGLTPGPLTVSFSGTTTATPTFFTVQMLNSSQGFLGSDFISFQPADGLRSESFQITVPANGIVVAGMDMIESGSGSVAYTVNVPEPSAAVALAGLSALALLGRRKKSDRDRSGDGGPRIE